MANAIRARLGPLVSKVHQTVAPAYKTAESAVSKQYEQVMKAGEEYVVKDPAEADKLLRKLVYTNLSRIPAGIKQVESEYGQVQSKVAKWNDMPLTEVGMYALFVGEIYAWFVVGEIVGRGFTFSGYKF